MPSESRIAVVDFGTNSTRLLIADLADGGELTEVQRRSEVTRLGDGVDTTGRLSDEAVARVLACLDDYRRLADEHGAGAQDRGGHQRGARLGERRRVPGPGSLGVGL